MVELCGRCEGNCLLEKQLTDLHERSGLRTIPSCKPGLDQESYSTAQIQQERSIEQAPKECPFRVVARARILENNKR